MKRSTGRQLKEQSGNQTLKQEEQTNPVGELGDSQLEAVSGSGGLLGANNQATINQGGSTVSSFFGSLGLGGIDPIY